MIHACIYENAFTGFNPPNAYKNNIYIGVSRQVNVGGEFNDRIRFKLLGITLSTEGVMPYGSSDLCLPISLENCCLPASSDYSRLSPAL